MSPRRIAMLGTVGIPAQYGGFETLTENLVRHHARSSQKSTITVWCSAKDNTEHPDHFEGANLRYVRLRANGLQSIPYDLIGLLQAIRSDHDQIVLLGVSGAIGLPFVRAFSRVRIITNIDGIEWKREKWRGLAQVFLRFSEWVAVRFSHEIIADNQAIADYVRTTYHADCHVIAYGGDHAVANAVQVETPEGLPESYALALCRVEPENNVHTILEAWAQLDTPIVFVGNWSNSPYGRDLRARYAGQDNMHLLDPIYDPAKLYALRAAATVYVHGHSAGGTNPALVEMMHFGVPVLAHGCVFNRYTTEGKARYFETEADLIQKVRDLTPQASKTIGADMLEIAQRLYTWDRIGAAYFALIERN